MDDITREFLSTFQRFMSEVVNQAAVESSDLTPLGVIVQDFLGAPGSAIPDNVASN